MRDRLLPLAVSEAEYARWKAGRAGAPADHAAGADVRARRRLQLERRAAAHRLLGAPHRRGVQRRSLRDRSVAVLSGLDRYETVTWRIRRQPRRRDRGVRPGRPKPYGPPFLMLGLNLENTTSEDFSVTLTGRYLAYDLSGPAPSCASTARSGRIPAWPRATTSRSAPRRCSSRRMPASFSRTFNVIEDDAVVASYGQRLSRGRPGCRREPRALQRYAPRRATSAGSPPTSMSAIRGCRRSRARRS